MSEAQNLFELMHQGVDDAEALAAPERPPLSFAGLRRHMQQTVTALNSLGIGRGDRVAIVLPNGPEMASSFISLSCAAVTAPLNPAYRKEDFRFYLEDLNARALVLLQHSDSSARAAAADLAIPILEIATRPEDPAGLFHFVQTGTRSCDQGGLATSDDVALVLHTSGTTSRPKMVPLSHANLTASADNIARCLRLGPTDRCLNVMPLFHIHGLVAAILASLGAGGSTYCTPGFDALRFFSWLADARPSWYTAVPTMHQALLQRADRNRAVIADSPLRFIRSCSSALPSQVMQELEAVFQVPVIEAYAMTEAAHQMTSNPLPPLQRLPGHVGIAAGPEVAIMDEAGRLLDPGEVGEVVVRGANVTAGYENNAEANASSYTDGWFRTGDQGVMNDQGYLRLTGRLKEIINRGGEKISPVEIDEVLMDHPAVRQVVTFALPHPKLGEEIASAIVLREGITTDAQAIREFAAGRLADFKVPRKVLFVDEIPKGATGKLQRIGLAERLGLV